MVHLVLVGELSAGFGVQLIRGGILYRETSLGFISSPTIIISVFVESPSTGQMVCQAEQSASLLNPQRKILGWES